MENEAHVAHEEKKSFHSVLLRKFSLSLKAGSLVMNFTYEKIQPFLPQLKGIEISLGCRKCQMHYQGQGVC
jgi:hypothetical protein